MAVTAQSMNLEDLRKGTPGITPTLGGCLCEAAGVCLEVGSHATGVMMAVNGAFASHSFALQWAPITDQTRRCYGDLQFAAEFGAYGIAALLVEQLTPLTVFERSRKGTGFDYWLAPKDSETPLFQDKQRLEVSGVLSGDESDLKIRMKEKLAQLNKGGVPLKGYGVVVHFAAPESRVGVP